jgi:hypothetical protein
MLAPHLRRLLSSLAVISILAACRSEPTSPPAPFNLLEFNARISKSVIHVGDTATVEFVLRNPTRGSVEFFIGCGNINPTIQNSSRQTVYRAADFFCAGSVAPVELAPGEEYVQRLEIRGIPRVINWSYAGVPLVVGRYTAYADLLGRNRSPTVQFEVVQ